MAVADIVRTEQIKLFAGMLDRVGTVCFAVGVATPISAFLIGAPQMPVVSIPWLIASIVAWSIVFIALHRAGHNALKDLRE
jgi:hypothetical protein